jgi:hypothetical protein
MGHVLYNGNLYLYLFISPNLYNKGLKRIHVIKAKVGA